MTRPSRCRFVHFLLCLFIFGLIPLLWHRYTYRAENTTHRTGGATVDGTTECVSLHTPGRRNSSLNRQSTVTHEQLQVKQIPDGEVLHIEARQRQRKSHLDQACQRLEQSRNLPPVSWERTVHFLVSDKYNFLFCFVPKVSCTTWKSIMSSLYHTDETVPKTKRFLKMNEIKDAYEVMQKWRTYRKVMFAREPLERALSAYLDKFVYGPEKLGWERAFGKQIVQRYRNNAVQHKSPLNIKFDEFIRFITDQGPNAKMSQMTDHWLPVSRITSPCQVQYDFIGHYETLAEDAPYVLKHYNLSNYVTFPEVHSSRSEEKLVKEYAKVPVQLIHRLVDYYKLDYELFGYSSNETLKIILNGRS